MLRILTGEVCVHRNAFESWAYHFKNLRVDLVVHNAAVVGTDVVALNSNEATLTNVAGTYNIVRACNEANIPICFLGTTVVYDTAKYQDAEITEESSLNPTTLYGIQKLAGEQIVKTHAKHWLVMRPLFAFGGVGDMNSLIAKSVFAKKNGRSLIDMFLDPNKIKDYLYVDDFCDAVVLGCEKGLFGNDFNVAAETPYRVSDIMKMIEAELKIDLGSVVKWHPNTDYLGNHRLSSKKFRAESGWLPKYDLHTGIAKAVEDITTDASDYDPLIHIDKARSEGVDLTQFFPKQ
jgi:nucleoside-diphosphate-sugar epimerase